MEIMAQPFLKPGVFGPLPISVGEILDIVEAAVCSALQEDELPVAELNFNRQFFPRYLSSDGQQRARNPASRTRSAASLFEHHLPSWLPPRFFRFSS